MKTLMNVQYINCFFNYDKNFVVIASFVDSSGSGGKVAGVLL